MLQVASYCGAIKAPVLFSPCVEERTMSVDVVGV